MHELYWKGKYNIAAPVQRYGRESGRPIVSKRRSDFEKSGALWVQDFLGPKYPSADEVLVILADAGYQHLVETDLMHPDDFIAFAVRLKEEHPVSWVPFKSLKTNRLYLCFPCEEAAVRARLMLT